MKNVSSICLSAVLIFAVSCQAKGGSAAIEPEGLVASQATTTSLTFEWKPVQDATSYDYRLLLSGGDEITHGTTKLTKKTCNSLLEDTSYDFMLRANAGSRVSDWVVCTATTKSETPGPGPGPGPEPSEDITYADFKIPANEDAHKKVLAFPGAEGGGMFTDGGRLGNVYHVTTLEDSGVGSLRYGIENAKRPCTIVFDVAGLISLSKPLKISQGKITIAGQTAPGDGICLKGYTFNIQASDVIVRYIRCRLGDETATEDDAMNCFYNNEGSPKWSNIIVDHCSMSWSTDECGSFYGIRNFTLQWCMLSESLTTSVHEKGPHGYGGIWGGQTASFHHNLLAHHMNRTPRLCGSRYSNQESQEKVEVINNVYYNWTGEGAYAGQGGSYNLLANYYKAGPATAEYKTHLRYFTPYPDDGKNHQAKGVCGKFYLEGNYMDSSVSSLSSNQKKEAENANNDNYASTAFVPKTGIVECTQADFKAASKFDISNNGSAVTTQSATDAFKSVLKYAGASLKRDEIDNRISHEAQNGTYTYEGGYKGSGKDPSTGKPYEPGKCGLIDTQTVTGGWPDYSATAEELAKVKDTDGDGMPDWFEDKAGLNKSSAADANIKTLDIHGRYTNLEMYLHYLVRDIVDGQYK